MGLYLGIFLVTLSGLMFEIGSPASSRRRSGTTTRSSRSRWRCSAGASAAFALHLLRGRLALSRERAAWLTLLYGLSLPLALWLIVRVPFHPDRLIVYFAVSLLPFLLAGAALSMLFAVEREHTARLYFADLAGASLGALAVTFLLSWLGGESAILAVALAPLAAAAASRRGRACRPASSRCSCWRRSA
jgi:peptidoglycan/LPS O-acetylase OafA/YrhL